MIRRMGWSLIWWVCIWLIFYWTISILISGIFIGQLLWIIIGLSSVPCIILILIFCLSFIIGILIRFIVEGLFWLLIIWLNRLLLSYYLFIFNIFMCNLFVISIISRVSWHQFDLLVSGMSVWPLHKSLYRWINLMGSRYWRSICWFVHRLLLQFCFVFFLRIFFKMGSISLS